MAKMVLLESGERVTVEVAKLRFAEKNTVKKVETPLELNTEKSTAPLKLNEEVINLLELSELKALATANGFKIGNRKQDAARKFVISKLVDTIL